MKIETSATPAITESPSEVTKPAAQVDRFETNATNLDALSSWGKQVRDDILNEFAVAPILTGDARLNNSDLLGSGVLGLRLESNRYEPNDPFVTDSPIRSQITGTLVKTLPNIEWQESKGVMETGIGMQGTLPLCAMPLGGALAFNFGFAPRTLIGYRICVPTAELFKPDDFNSPSQLVLPTSAISAMKLPIGTEVELTGIGQLEGFAGLSLHGGLDIGGGFATFGAALIGSASESYSGEFAINVMSLDGKGKVRVTIRQINDISNAWTARLLLGCVSPTTSTDMPPWGSGVLGYLVANRVERPLQNLLTKYGSISYGNGSSNSQQQRLVLSYDLDLNDRGCQTAFDNLIHLKPSPANQLALKKSPAISKMEWRESGDVHTDSSDITLLGEKIFLREALVAAHDGSLKKPGGATKSYTDAIYQKVRRSIFGGESTVKWETVDIQGATKETHRYSHFYCDRHDKDPAKKDFSQFLRFASTLGMSVSLESEAELTASNDMRYSVDAFFTTDGVKRIEAADQEEGTRAFVQAATGSSELFQYRNLFEDYFKACSSWNYYLVGSTKETFEIEVKYLKKTGRDLRDDYNLYAKAKRFGKILATFTQARDPRNSARFFDKLDPTAEFEPLQVLLALAHVAGRNNLLVNQLSIAGDGLRVTFKEDSPYVHPADEANQLIHRAI